MTEEIQIGVFLPQAAWSLAMMAAGLFLGKSLSLSNGLDNLEGGAGAGICSKPAARLGWIGDSVMPNLSDMAAVRTRFWVIRSNHQHVVGNGWHRQADHGQYDQVFWNYTGSWICQSICCLVWCVTFSHYL